MTDNTNRYSTITETLIDLEPEFNTAHQTKPIPARPTLSQTLTHFGPMPKEALFLGVALDGLPVLLNLYDHIPGPLLIAGDSNAGKTMLLKAIAHGVETMHQMETVQFGTLTNHPEEWNGFDDVPNNIGTFPIEHKSSQDFILSLASWAHGNRSGARSILLILDGLDAVTNMDMDTVQNLRWLLLRGPSKRIWPIVTLNSQYLETMEPWLSAFHTRIFGKVQDLEYAQKLSAGQAGLETLDNPHEFALREGNHWLKFWVPSLE